MFSREKTAAGQSDRHYAAIYNQHDFDDEKQIALATLERQLNRILSDKGVNKVIPIASAFVEVTYAGTHEKAPY